MNTLNHCSAKMQLLNNQISTLLFCALESSSPVEIQALIEMAIEKNEVIKSELNYAQTKHEPILQSSFAARLRLALKERGITQAELAKDIGVSQSVASSIVTGKVSEAGIVRSSVIAIAVGVRLDWLLYGEGEMNSHPFFGSNKAED